MDTIRSIVKKSQSKSEAISLIRESKDYQFLNAGNDRIVAINEGRSEIAKIEINPRQNEREHNIYKEKTNLRKYLLPIKRHSPEFKYVICPVAQYDVDRNKKIEFLESIKENFGLFPRDFRMDEIGRCDKGIILTDYGFGFQSIDSQSDKLNDYI
jgi:hypothetical protein